LEKSAPLSITGLRLLRIRTVIANMIFSIGERPEVADCSPRDRRMTDPTAIDPKQPVDVLDEQAFKRCS